MKVNVSLLLILIISVTLGVADYLFDIPERGQWKRTVKHNFLKKHAKDIELQSGNEIKRQFRQISMKKCDLEDQGGKQVLKTPSQKVNLNDCLEEMFNTRTNVLTGGMFANIYVVEISSINVPITIKGKIAPNEAVFWNIKGDFDITLTIPSNFDFVASKIDISGTYTADNKDIEISAVKDFDKDFFDILKFDSTENHSNKKMKDIFAAIQPTTAAFNFLGDMSYVKAGVIDDMLWKEFKGYGKIDQNKQYNLVIQATNAVSFPKTGYSADMAFLVTGTSNGAASNLAFLSRFTDVEIAAFWDAITTRPGDFTSSLGRISKSSVWCLSLSASNFKISPTRLSKNSFLGNPFKDCFLEETKLLESSTNNIQEITYNINQHTTFLVQIIPSQHLLGCQTSELNTKLRENANEVKVMTGNLGPTGITWSYPFNVELKLSQALRCLRQHGQFSQTIPPLFADDEDITVKINDFYRNRNTNYLSASLLYELPEDKRKICNLLSASCSDVFKDTEFLSVQFSFEKKYQNIDVSLLLNWNIDDNVPAAITLTYSAPSSWNINLFVPSLTFEQVVQQVDTGIPEDEVSDENFVKADHLIKTKIQNLILDINIADGSFSVRLKGRVTVEDLTELVFEILYSHGKGLKIGIFAPTINLDGMIQKIFKESTTTSQPWLQSLSGVLIFSTIEETDDDETSFHDQDLSEVNLGAGVYFSLVWTRMDSQSDECTANAFCDFLYKNLISGSEIELQGQYESRQLDLSFRLKTDIRIYDSNLWFTEGVIYLSVDFGDSFEIKVGLQCTFRYSDPDSTIIQGRLEITGVIEAGTDGLRLAFSLSNAMLKNVFGRPQFAITYLGVDAEVDFKTRSFTIGFETTLRIGKVETEGDYMEIDAYIDINPVTPLRSGIFLRNTHKPLLIENLGRYFEFEPWEKIKDNGFPRGFTFSYAPEAFTFHDGTEISRGLYFDGEFKFLEFEGKGKINLNLDDKIFEVDAFLKNMSSVSLLGVSGFKQEGEQDLFKISGFKGEDGPHLQFYFNMAEPLELKGSINGQFEILGTVVSATSLVINSDKFELQQRFGIFEVGLSFGIDDNSIPRRLSFTVTDRISLKNILIAHFVKYLQSVQTFLTTPFIKLRQMKENAEQFVERHTKNQATMSEYFNTYNEVLQWAKELEVIANGAVNCVNNCATNCYDYVKQFWKFWYIGDCLSLLNGQCPMVCGGVATYQATASTLRLFYSQLEKVVALLLTYLDVDFQAIVDEIDGVFDQIKQKFTDFVNWLGVDIRIDTFDLSGELHGRIVAIKGSIDITIQIPGVLGDDIRIEKNSFNRIETIETIFADGGLGLFDAVVREVSAEIEERRFNEDRSEEAEAKMSEIDTLAEEKAAEYTKQSNDIDQFEQEFRRLLKPKAENAIQQLEAERERTRRGYKRHCIPQENVTMVTNECDKALTFQDDIAGDSIMTSDLKRATDFEKRYEKLKDVVKGGAVSGILNKSFGKRNDKLAKTISKRKP